MTPPRTGFEVAAEYKMRATAAEAKVEELEARIKSLRQLVSRVLDILGAAKFKLALVEKTGVIRHAQSADHRLSDVLALLDRDDLWG